MNASSDPRRLKGQGRVRFMAHLAEITGELDAGRALTAVYESRRGRLGISYRQFARYVDRFIHCSAPVEAPLPPRLARPEPPVRLGTTTSAEASHAERDAPRSFNHDPVERPDDRRRLLGEN